MNFKILAILATITAGAVAPANAATILTLFNTGTNGANTSVVGVGVVDQHWTLVGGTAYASGSNGVFPVQTNWLAETTTSRWLTPAPHAGASLDPTADGTYTYSLEFWLTGYHADLAAFSGRFAADNEVLSINLNGTSLTSSSGNYNIWTSFASTGASFADGLNTLTFVISNTGQANDNPSGLRVEVGGTAPVPEPATWALLGAGFGLVGFSARRRSKAVAA